MNNTIIPLGVGASFTGQWQATDDFAVISVNLNASSFCLLTIQQSHNKGNIDNSDSLSYQPGQAIITQQTIGLQYFRVIVENVDITTQTFLRLISSLSINRTVGVDIRTLSAFANSDNVEIVGRDAESTKRYILTDASGALIVKFV